MESVLVRVRKVEPLEARRVRLEFTDGKVREIDLTPLLRGPVFEQVRQDETYFRMVRVNDSEPTWESLGDLRVAAIGQAARRIIMGG